MRLLTAPTLLTAPALAHGAVGPADEIAGLAAVPVTLLVLFVVHLRRRSRARGAQGHPRG